MATIEYQQLRSAGASITSKERELARIQEKISFVEAQRQRRQSEGKRDAETYRMDELQSLRQRYSSASQEYQNLREGLGESGYGAAIAAAPKRYRESRFSERAYDPGGEGPGKSESRSYFQAKELASKQPGIYQYKTGGAFISTSGDGSFVNQQGEYIEVRSPIGQRNDGSFIYKPKSERKGTGIVLDEGGREALSQGAKSGSFATAGALFTGVIAQSNSQQSKENNFSRLASFAPAASDGQSFFGGIKKAAISGPIPFAMAVDKTASIYGDTLKNESRSFYTNPLNVTAFNQAVDSTVPNTLFGSKKTIKTAYGDVSGLINFPNRLYQDPVGATKTAIPTVGLSFIGGLGTGQVVKSIAARSVSRAAFFDTSLKVGFGGLLLYQNQKDPVSVGENLPYIAAGGFAFQKGFSSVAPTSVKFAGFERTNPRSERVPRFFESETAIRPQEFVSVGRGRAAFDVVEFGKPSRVTSDVLSVTRGGRAYSQTTGRALGSYNVKQSTSFDGFKVAGKDYNIPVLEQSGYIMGKETALVDRSGFITLSKQARNLNPTERIGLTKLATRDREYAEIYQVAGARFKTKPRGMLSVDRTFSRANVETGFGFDVFKLRRQPVIRGRIGGRVQPTALGSRSERFEFNTILGREKSLIGKIERPARPFERQAVKRLRSRGFLSAESQPMGRRGELTLSFEQPKTISRQRYTSRAPRVRFYQDLSTPRLSSSLLSKAPFSTLSSSRLSFDKGPASILGQQAASRSITTVDVTSRSLITPFLDVRSTQNIDTRSLIRTDTLLRTQPFQSSTIDTVPDVPVPPDFPGGGPFGVPLFGPPGGGSSGGRGRGRAFKYAPSLNALIFNIKGRKEKKRLTGFETRPILQQTR